MAMLKTIALWAAAGLALSGLAAAGIHAQTQASATRGTPEERARAVLGQMTTDEKLTLVKGYFGTDFGTAFTASPEARTGSAGYVPGIPRLGIPPQWETDAGMGVATQGGAKSKRPATALPSGLAVAASWDPDVAYAGGRMIGGEARAYGFNVILAGGANLVREPRNGRNFEYAGEDPLLAGTIAGAAIDGIQSNHIVSTLKHYALNAQETDRGKINAVIDEDAARMSDLLAFQLAMERGRPGSVMCAYNRVNGPYACESPFLLTQVLRDDWHFAGYVMSDWGAVHSAEDAAKAGLDQESGFGLHRDDNFGAKLADAIAAGKVSRKRLDQMAEHILTAMFAQGLIDYPLRDDASIDFRADQQVSLAAAQAGAVLLRNEDALLPLAGDKPLHIAVIGGHADKGVLSGAGSSQVYSDDGPGGGNAVPGLEPTSWPGPVFHYPSSPLDELRMALPEAKIDYVDGSNVVAARLLAADADVAIVFATQWTGESKDFPLTLPDDQDRLIAAVAEANPDTVVVLETGGPVLMPWNDQVKAVLEAWYPGRMGGLAIANLLTGKANPSGALPVTFPASLAQLPHPEDPPAGEVTYSEGAAAGYKWLDKQGAEPLYPFGYGLSYATFEMGDFKVAADADGKLTATVSLTNTGERAGAKTVQLYAAHPGGDDLAWEAPRRLVGFHKFDLAPGETKTATIEIDPRLLATYHRTWNGWVIDKGDYVLSAGFSSRALQANAQVAQKLKYLPHDWRPGDKF
jgi:beta-glucosidase